MNDEVLAVQKHRLIAIELDSLAEDTLLFRRMSASEQLGRLFEYQLELLSEDNNIPFEKVLGGNMTLRMELLGEGKTRYYNAYVSRFCYVGTSGRYAVYEATLRPWLWFLTRTADCRIFQNKTVPQIVGEVFRDHGFTDFEENLSEQYRTWEYCVQYRETDFNFVSRLLEQEGIYYYFEHHNGFHKLVLCDSLSAHDTVDDYEEIPYFPPEQSERRERDHIFDWIMTQQVQPGAVALNDFDFKAPRKSLRNQEFKERDHAASHFEIYDYPGEYSETGEGKAYAKVRLDELQSQHETVQGQGNALGLTAGALFKLIQYPRDDQNKQYMVISANYELESDDYITGGGGGGGRVFHCSFTALDVEQPYRAPRVTPKPVVQGPQTAIIVGKQGEEIWTDEHGRVKVQFHWDRYGKADENSSCWIRVAQVWAGKNWGGMFIPRIGQEVIVEFLEGDPDHPIITGRVYNGISKTPYELPANATMSGVKTLSSKGGAGFNEIRFEDKKGEEQIFVHGEKNQDVRIKNDRYEWIGNDRHLIVKKDKFEHVENERHEIVDNHHYEKIKADRHVDVGGKEAIKISGSHSFTVTGDVIEVFKANHSEQTSQNYYLKAMGVVIEAMTGITLKCGGSSVVIDPSGVTIKGPMVTVDGGMIKIASGPGSPPAAGVAGSAVTAAAASEALEADNAEPGEMAEIKAEQQSKKSGKYGKIEVKPHKKKEPGDDEDEKNPYWIEIVLKDEDGNPVVGEAYEITMPDGETVARGSLDENGFARVDGIKDSGQCQVSFPNLDREAWE